MSGKPKDLTGQRFGRLLVKEYAGTDNAHRARWLCSCDCGNTKVIYATHLKSGDIQSCGCLHRELTKARCTKHGLQNTRLYSIWAGMVHRCTNEKHVHFDLYGGRGIKVCNEWLESVTAFYNWAMGSGYSESLTLDRIDPDGNYCPENCRWATMKEQGKNRRTTILIEINGDTKTAEEWSIISGLKYSTILYRYHNGERGEKLLRKAHKEAKG